jgi:predicted nucleic acid-binding protein
MIEENQNCDQFLAAVNVLGGQYHKDQIVITGVNLFELAFLVADIGIAAGGEDIDPQVRTKIYAISDEIDRISSEIDMALVTLGGPGLSAMISVIDQEIAKIAKKYGAVEFKREEADTPDLGFAAYRVYSFF